MRRPAPAPYERARAAFHVQLGRLPSRSHSGTRYYIEFADSESYVCHFEATFDSENGGELDIEDDNPLEDEFAQAAMEIIESIHGGLHRYDDALMLDNRDWPATIKNVDTGAVSTYWEALLCHAYSHDSMRTCRRPCRFGRFRKRPTASWPSAPLRRR
jgi:hypothetical protein